MTSRADPRKHRGLSVYVLCEVAGRRNGTAEIWIIEPGQTYTTKVERLISHPSTQKSLCAAKLLYTNQGIATILVRQADDEPVEVKVLMSRIHCEVEGRLIKFRSWKELKLRREKSRNGKEKRRRLRSN